MLRNIKLQEREKVYESWSFMVIVSAKCSHFGVILSSDDTRKSYTAVKEFILMSLYVTWEKKTA